ncbi:MAG TPA: hydroxymethylbilane synthase [Acidobacteriaceae bacterium]|jgi:hydroxymethylbilane synthase|nr:hydroxymethylbilane synthase [Acidobacteriaceae bacterium]
MSNPTLRIGTRGSELALWQANYIAGELRRRGYQVSVEIIRTTGDRMQDPASSVPSSLDVGSPLDAKGIFIKELEDSLAAGRIDLAVHSLKDLPTALDPRFTLAAIPTRADARDAFVCESAWGLHMLPSGARIGTTSPRRQAMLLALRPDVRFVELRGNVDTRLRKWQEGQADALVLAAAGLDRLNRTAHVHQRFSVDELCPAPGQGALALEVRCPSFKPCHPEAHRGPRRAGSPGWEPKDLLLDTAIHEAVAALNDPDAAFATTAERTVLHALGGGCSLPVGAYCHAEDDRWHLHAMVVSPDGEQVAHVIEKAPPGIPPEELGHRAAEALKARGALELLAEPARA